MISHISTLNLYSPDGSKHAFFHLDNDGVITVQGVRAITGLPVRHRKENVVAQQIADMSRNLTEQMDVLAQKISELEGSCGLDLQQTAKSLRTNLETVNHHMITQHEEVLATITLLQKDLNAVNACLNLFAATPPTDAIANADTRPSTPVTTTTTTTTTTFPLTVVSMMLTWWMALLIMIRTTFLHQERTNTS